MNVMQMAIKQIAPFMKTKGFSLSGKNFYYISNDIAFCIALDMPSGLLYVTAYIMPIYLPCQNRYYTYGIRMNELCGNVLPVLKKTDDKIAVANWCNALCEYIDAYILPFYKKIDSPSKLMKHIEHNAEFALINLRTPNVFLSRLKMYTHFYLKNDAELRTEKIRYRNLLLESHYMTDSVRQMYLDEINKIDTLLQGSKQDMVDYFTTIAENTKKILS